MGCGRGRGGGSFGAACAVVPEIFVGNLFRRYELVVFLRHNGQSLIALLEFKQGDYACLHELSGEWSTYQRREFITANRDVLLDLHDTEFVASTFGLNRENIVRSLFV